MRPLPGERLEPTDEKTIGREHCDVTLDHPLVSRRHAVLRGGHGRLEIEDLGSRNGTYVNNLRLEPAQDLAEGDEVRIGETVWRVESAAAATVIGQTPAVAGTSGAPTSRGDVPPPAPPSVVAPAPPPPQPAAPALQVAAAPFQEGAPSRRRRVSAARRLEATLVSYAVVAATAAGVIAYLATR